ncbi:hypothetical protein [Phreatobacter sp. AB_2022a]|uniref:hypothetical protein n=1 Tax=Phreatobacter sp. AB_2022a TaxID=3003134 RepID=UPI002286E185|nr:hypothetical protein [Phreatobacter sp. AB_2022a]MCZ0732954.1 hypothetical protein [Phreatobacter sp. AB_2022a]
MSPIGRKASLRLAVTAAAGDAKAYALAVGAEPSAGRLPSTYPIRWLTDAAVVALMRDLGADKPGALPVHEMQTVEPVAPLPLDTPLTLAVEAHRSDAIHVDLKAEVAQADGRVLARLHTLLRLLP